jgi:hypothetical protein
MRAMASSSMISTPDSGLHPFSCLNERVQQGTLADLLYTDEGYSEGKWRARVSVQSDEKGALTGRAAASSKQMAKKAAAQSVIQQLIQRK